MESLKVSLDNPAVVEAFSEAGVGDQCVIVATVTSKDADGLSASIDTVEYDGYEYEVGESGGVAAKEVAPPDKPAPKPKANGLMAMAGAGKMK